jgi:predicted RNase H-like HicB family nuclease
MNRSLTYTILIHETEPDETGYWVDVPALPGCVTQGETLEECIAHAREAIEGHIETLADVGEPVPIDDVVESVRVTISPSPTSAAA